MEIFSRDRKLTPIVEDVVDQHAESLSRGQDTTDKIAAQYNESFPALDGLLKVAQRLQNTLVPVEPEEEFVTDLQSRLEKIQTRRIRSANRLASWRGRAGQSSRSWGAIVSVIAVIALAAQVLGSILMVVMIFMGNKRRRRTAASA
ncbi:MAG: hypothetical protein JXJ17_01685 [Anaerolineae bacterium]|nr:hypothetical protein [Anaerolineae bacterium]